MLSVKYRTYVKHLLKDLHDDKKLPSVISIIEREGENGVVVSGVGKGVNALYQAISSHLNNKIGEEIQYIFMSKAPNILEIKFLKEHNVQIVFCSDSLDIDVIEYIEENKIEITFIRD